MSEKTVNYTALAVQKLREGYDPAADEETRDAQIVALADELGKTTKSVRAKLVREGLYVKKAYKTKTGDKPETKEAIVNQIADFLGVDADSSLSGLEKATKNCLILLRGTFAAVAASDEETETETDNVANFHI